VLRFSRSFTKPEQSTENLPGYIPWEPVISMQSLRPNLLSSLLQHTRYFFWAVSLLSVNNCMLTSLMCFLMLIICSFLFQAALLLLFNGTDRLSYSEIVTQLNLSDDDVVRLLHSLSCAKYKILNKEPANRSISPNDVFEFNSKFTDRMRRIKVFLFLSIFLAICGLVARLFFVMFLR
jgi:hypothetical protein